jgi:hypothetical protein
MKAVLALVLVAFGAATAVASPSSAAISNSVTALAVEVMGESREPVILLLSGTLLLGLAGAVQRFTV